MKFGMSLTKRFNTQPPEGGWLVRRRICGRFISFNTQPPEGGWDVIMVERKGRDAVSTHSRLKAAGLCHLPKTKLARVSTHSRLKAAGLCHLPKTKLARVSTHSRLKAAGTMLNNAAFLADVSTHSRLKAAGSLETMPRRSKPCFNTQPPEGGWMTMTLGQVEQIEFQHTAA